MNKFLYILFYYLPFTGIAQSVTKELRFPEVGWTLQIPPGAGLNPAQIDSLLEVTNEKLREGAVGPIDTKHIRVLFTFLDKAYNSFGSTLVGYDSTRFPTWAASHASAKQQLMGVFAAVRNVEVIDTASSIERIDQLSFERFSIKTNYREKGITMQTYWYSRLQGKYELDINVSYTDEGVGRRFLDILRHSTFDK